MTDMYIITHNGKFHLDEILACSVLLKINPHAKIIRTRDYDLINTHLQSDTYIAVVDVYGQYDASRRLYDHHQRGFTETFSSKFNIKLSSAGLVFKHHGKEFIKSYMPDLDDEDMNMLVDEIYSEYFLYADAIDNGIEIGGTIRPRSMQDVVDSFNTTDSERWTEAFFEALEFVKLDMERYMKNKTEWVDSYKRIGELVRNAEDDILIVENDYGVSRMVPVVEKKYGKDIKYVINKDKDGYKIYAVAVSRNSFESKVPLRQEWRGLRADELIKKCGIEQSVFVHSTGFMGINTTLEGALEMCRRSLR